MSAIRTSRRRVRSDAGTGLKKRALEAVLSGYCNTTQDVADELDVPAKKVQAYVSLFVSAGIIRRTNRRMPNINPVNRGGQLRVFEVVTHA